MRVLHVIPSVAARRGGPSAVVLGLSRALSERGVEVAILSTWADLDEAGADDARKALGSTVGLELVRAVGPAQLEVSPGLVRALWRRLPSVDVVHVHTVFTFPVAAPPILCRSFGVVHVIRPAGTLDEDCLVMKSRRRKQLALAAYVRRNLRGADAVHATSDKEARELRRLEPASRVEVVEVGASAARVAADAGSRGRRVGSLGRLHPKKQIDVLVRALALLPQDTELLLAGDGEAAYVDSLRALARSLSVGGRTHFLGHLGEAAKRDFLASCDVLAFPSKDENFGVAVAESMAAGRAVVVSPGVALADLIVSEGAGVVAAAEPEAFARALAGLLDDGVARARRAAAGRVLAARRWNWNAVADATLALYEQVLRRRRR